MLTALLLAPISFLLWCVIHEATHLVTAAILLDLKSWKIVPFPWPHKGKWLFARVDYSPAPKEKRHKFLITMAPTVPRLVAMVAIFFVPWPWVVLVGGGLVDMAVGSHVDLRKLRAPRLVHVGSIVLPVLVALAWGVVRYG